MRIDKLKVLYVSSEMLPFAKSGGLADVAASLPKKLMEQGLDIRVAMPAYQEINTTKEYVTDFPLKMGDRIMTCVIRKGCNNSVPVYFIDSHYYFGREGMYCHHDDGERFTFFNKGLLKMLKEIDFKPDIIHCNDWHTGPLCMLLKEKYTSNDFYKDMKTVLTIHNLEYQGHFPYDVFKLYGVRDDIFNGDGVEFYGNFNFMKAGLLYTDYINAVSKKYAEEIKTPECGELLEGVLADRKDSLKGIINGISFEEFNPETDKHLYKNYNSNDFSNKYENKRLLQKELGLPQTNGMLIGIVHRLTGQKGLELVMERIEEVLEGETQLVLLGVGDPFIENMFLDFAKKYPNKVAVKIEFNESLARKIYSGADVFLMPSKFEPCGLGQLISFRYGTVPIVRRTGGLADTVIDFNSNTDIGNGFVFTEYKSEGFISAFENAANVYYNKKKMWKSLVKRVLEIDSSWDKAAKEYIDMYRFVFGS